MKLPLREEESKKMKTDIKKVRRELENRKNKHGLVGTVLKVGEEKGRASSANISLDWKEINLNYGEELELIPDLETERFCSAKDITDAEMKLGESLIDHEVGHRELPSGTRFGCPYTVEMHDHIKDKIMEGLSKKGKAGLTSYVTNAFEDVLDNVNCRRTSDFAGMTLFWNNQGLVNSPSGKFSPFYEAFVRTNLILGGNVRDNTLLKRFNNESEEVVSAIKNFMGDFTSKLGLKNPVRLHEKRAFEDLFSQDFDMREKLWGELAYSFAYHMADLIDEEDMPLEVMFGTGADGTNPFDKEMEIPGDRERIAKKRYKQGKGPSNHRDFQEQLYDLYKIISKDIPVETSQYSDAKTMPIVHYGRRDIGEDEDLNRLRFRGVGVNDKGELTLRTTRHSQDYPVSFKKNPHNFPKLKIALVDRSASMKKSPFGNDNVGDKTFIPWGDKSKIHYAYKGSFGVDNYLERQGIAHYVSAKVLGFSGEETLRGDMREVGKRMLLAPGGGTRLDVDGLERELEENSLVLSISDGEISNFTEEVKKRFDERLSTPGVNYAHIQIGGQTAFSKHLVKSEIPVFYVRGDEDLSQLMVSFVSTYYNERRQDNGK